MSTGVDRYSNILTFIRDWKRTTAVLMSICLPASSGEGGKCFLEFECTCIDWDSSDSYRVSLAV